MENEFSASEEFLKATKIFHDQNSVESLLTVLGVICSRFPFYVARKSGGIGDVDIVRILSKLECMVEILVNHDCVTAMLISTRPYHFHTSFFMVYKFFSWLVRKIRYPYCCFKETYVCSRMFCLKSKLYKLIGNLFFPRDLIVTVTVFSPRISAPVFRYLNTNCPICLTEKISPHHFRFVTSCRHIVCLDCFYRWITYLSQSPR